MKEAQLSEAMFHPTLRHNPPCAGTTLRESTTKRLAQRVITLRHTVACFTSHSSRINHTVVCSTSHYSPAVQWLAPRIMNLRHYTSLLYQTLLFENQPYSALLNKSLSDHYDFPLQTTNFNGPQLRAKSSYRDGRHRLLKRIM